MSAPYQEYPDSRRTRWLVWGMALALVAALVGVQYGSALVERAQEIWAYYTVSAKDPSQDPAVRGNIPTEIMGESPPVSGPARTPLVPEVSASYVPPAPPVATGAKTPVAGSARNHPVPVQQCYDVQQPPGSVPPPPGVPPCQ